MQEMKNIFCLLDWKLILFFFWSSYVVSGILVPQTGMEPIPPSVEAWNPNPWTTREFLRVTFFNYEWPLVSVPFVEKTTFLHWISCAFVKNHLTLGLSWDPVLSPLWPRFDPWSGTKISQASEPKQKQTTWPNKVEGRGMLGFKKDVFYSSGNGSMKELVGTMLRPQRRQAALVWSYTMKNTTVC